MTLISENKQTYSSYSNKIWDLETKKDILITKSVIKTRCSLFQEPEFLTEAWINAVSKTTNKFKANREQFQKFWTYIYVDSKSTYMCD